MKMEIELTINPGSEVPAWAKELIDKMGLVIRNQDTQTSNQEKIMATLDQVLQDVTDESTAIDSVAALITGLRQQVADALSGATLPPATQAKIESIFTQAETNKGKIAAALADNVPATPAP